MNTFVDNRMGYLEVMIMDITPQGPYSPQGVANKLIRRVKKPFPGIRRKTYLGPDELEEFKQELLNMRKRMLAGSGHELTASVDTLNSRRSLLNEIDQALERIESELESITEIKQLVTFVRESDRGIVKE